MSASPEAVARIEHLYRAFGHIPDAPRGPIVAHFDAVALASAIESEVGRINGVGKITLHMDPPDAMALALLLRRSRKRG